MFERTHIIPESKGDELNKRGIESLLDKLNELDFLDGEYLKEKDAYGEYLELISFDDQEEKTFSHSLDRAVKGFIPMDVFDETGNLAIQCSLSRKDNPNGQSTKRYVTFRNESSASAPVKYRIWIF